MWFIVVVEEWEHWDSEFSKVRSIPVYTISQGEAEKCATAGMSCHCIHQVISCGSVKPQVVFDDRW